VGTKEKEKGWDEVARLGMNREYYDLIKHSSN
jgi:hypothetical protein